MVGVNLPNGWYVVVANNFSRFGRKEPEHHWSEDCDVVICDVEERVGCSSAEAWRNGKHVWSIVHDASGGTVSNLTTTGELPPAFAAIRDQRQAEQEAAGGAKAKVDYFFDIPLEVARSLTGFAHDQDPPGGGDEPYEVLEPIGGAARSRFSRRLFGLGLVLALFCGFPLLIGVVYMLFFMAMGLLRR